MTHTPRAATLLLSLATLAAAASPTLAQLVPDRMYYGVDRKAPMTVSANGDAEIRLFDPATREVVASAPAVDGGVDFASLFPELWTQKSEQVRYAQLFVDDRAVGAPVVLVPMVSVDRAILVNPQTGQPVQRGQRGKPLFDSQIAEMQARPRSVVYSGVRAYVSKDVVLETSMGEIRIRLRPDVAPNHAWNFRTLVEGGYYTDIIFHRVVPSFVVQVGDPTGVGSGGPGHHIDLENSSLLHDFGVLSMARTGEPDTGGSQIFICLTRQATAQLDGSYTTFGESIAGADTIIALGNTPVQGQTPVDPPVLERAYLVDTAPLPAWPAVVKRPEATPAGETGEETGEAQR
jgi:peptidyl-prolyl cis-trans isomerase B (cyclophilin B)